MPRMTINIPRLISLRIKPGDAYMFPIYRVRAIAIHWQTRRVVAAGAIPPYLSIIIIADNGALDASNYRKIVAESQLRRVCSRSASFMHAACAYEYTYIYIYVYIYTRYLSSRVYPGRSDFVARTRGGSGGIGRN